MDLDIDESLIVKVDPKLLPPVNKELGEVDYFSQYVKFLNNVFENAKQGIFIFIFIYFYF